MAHPSTSDGAQAGSATPPPIPRRSSARPRDRAQSFNFSYPRRYAVPKGPEQKGRLWLQDSDADSSSSSLVSSSFDFSGETDETNSSHPSLLVPPLKPRVRWDQETSRSDTTTPPPIESAPTNKSSSSLSRVFKPRAQDSLSIERRVSVDQQSERVSLENTSSRENNPLGENDHPSRTSSKSSDTEWKSSNFDISSMSPAEIEKCKKKGINPALYMEMRAARKGKGKWISPLVGNTFLG